MATRIDGGSTRAEEGLTPSAGSRGWRRLSRRPEPWLFTAVVALQVVSVAVLPIDTVDGPAHLAGASVIAHYWDSAGAVLRHYYRLDLFPSPNLLAGLLLAGLLRVFSPGVAEKVVVSGYVVLFPLALRYAVRAVRPGAEYLSYAAFALTFNYLFWYGFYNFCYGLALSLFAVGYAIRHCRSWTPRAGVVLAGLLVLTYAAHLVPLVTAMVLIIVLFAHVALTQRSLRAGAVRAASLVPVVVLAVGFALRGGQHGSIERRPTWELVRRLAGMTEPILTDTPRERIPCMLLALTLLVLTGYALFGWGRRRRSGLLPGRSGGEPGLRSSGEPGLRSGGEPGLRSLGRPLALSVVLAVVVYLAAPARFGLAYGLINTRFSFFPVLFLLLWLATVPLPRRLAGAAALTMLVASLVLGVLRLPSLRFYGDAVAEYESVRPSIRPGSTMLALRYWRDRPPPGRGSIRNEDPLLHVAGRLAAETRGIDVGHYEATYNYFPTQFRPGHDLRRRIDPDLAGLEAVPPRVRLGAAASGPEHIDYVLVVGRNRATARTLSDPVTGEVLNALRAHYRPVAVSSPTGLVELWAWRG